LSLFLSANPRIRPEEITKTPQAFPSTSCFALDVLSLTKHPGIPCNRCHFYIACIINNLSTGNCEWLFDAEQGIEEFSLQPTALPAHGAATVPCQLSYHIPVTIPTTHVPTLLVHGGAWAIPADAAVAHEAGVRNALEAGYALLSRGGSAVDAVEAAVTVLEDDPTFDAGRGSFLTSDGRVQMDALLMDGGRMKAGGVACVEHLRNPIQAARLVLEQSPHVYFVGDGAEQFAWAHGMPLIQNAELVLDRERERLAHAQARQSAGLADETFSGHILHDDKSPETAFPSQDDFSPASPADDPTKWSHDTVGAVALDAHGNLAAATSTGGTLNKTPGRVGDSSLIGCGCYADNLSAAVSLTGWGEPIMKLVLGKWATDRVADGTAPELAAREAISYLFNRLGGHGGIILLGPDGRFGLAHNTPAMAWGLATPSGLHTGLTA
jgi:beta-aspartyl-peptidase (threonine type)